MTTIIIVDDHVLFREGLRLVMAGWDGFEVVGEASDGEAALRLARTVMPDLALMDVSMPGMDGIEATRRLTCELPTTRVVMLTVSEHEDDLFRALKNGACGYVLKNVSSHELREKLGQVLQGEAPLSGLMAAKIIKELSQASGKLASARGSNLELLTEREQQVLELVAQGRSNAEVAQQLFLSENTVKKHVRNVLQKLHVNNRVQAALYALAQGLIDRPPQ
jgi:DNA-binding NarL/FixJ family response regulator